MRRAWARRWIRSPKPPRIPAETREKIIQALRPHPNAMRDVIRALRNGKPALAAPVLVAFLV